MEQGKFVAVVGVRGWLLNKYPVRDTRIGQRVADLEASKSRSKPVSKQASLEATSARSASRGSRSKQVSKPPFANDSRGGGT